MEEEEEATQLATQPLPGHEGEPPSNADSNFLNGVICLLHPSSPEAYKAVERLSLLQPSHVLKLPPDVKKETGSDTAIPDADGEEEEPATQLETPGNTSNGDGLDIALRVMPGPKDPTMGFVFGRNANRCDIVIGEGQRSQRVSNTHFRIFQNPKGVLMLEDFSMNGTWVDNMKLGGRNAPDVADHGNGSLHALFAGSIILVASGAELIRFVVRIPSQSGSRICSDGATPGASFGVGIDPGPAPLPSHLRVPHLRNTGAPLSPRNNQNLAAIRRAPLRPHEMHTSTSAKSDPVWDGGGKYKMMEIVGSGAFATVKRAILKKTGEVFAVKMIQKRAFASQTGSAKANAMRKEVDILRKLNHPNVVGCTHYAEDAAHIYIIMEYVEGGDLNGYLKRNEYMREDMVQEVSRQLLNGIKYVHSMRISHRDLKPDNILLASEDPLVVKISDFGLAKMIQSEETFLKTFCGTMLYLAPEVYPGYAAAMVVGGGSFKRKRHPKEEAGREDALGAKARRRYSEAVDMWSLGCVIHTLLTGKSAFEGKYPDQMLKLILKGFRNTEHLDNVLGRGCDVVKDFLGRLLQVDPINRMTEDEALNHDWLRMGSDRSSSSMDEDQDDEICHEGDDGYQMVENEREEWTKMPSSLPGKWVDSAEADDDDTSDGKSPPPKLEDDALSGAVRKMSFQSIQHLGKGPADDSVGSFLSIDNSDAESQVGSRMFQPPPDISIRRCSSEFPEDSDSMYLTASVGLPDNNASTSEEAPVVYDNRVDFASQAVPGSEVRTVDDSVAGTAALVDKLRVYSPILEDPSRGPNIPQQAQYQFNQASQALSEKGPVAETSNFSSFDDPAVVYSTPYSLLRAPDGSQTPPSQNTANNENHLPLSQPCNVLPLSQPYDQLEPKNIIKPNPPWGKLVPIEGSAPYGTICMNRQITMIGRSSDCTYTISDIRVSKTHLSLMLAYPGVTCQPPDSNNWRPQPQMIAWIKVFASNGCRLNGMKKRQDSVVRVYNGDVIHIYWDSNNKNDFLAFRCEFAVGDHKRLQPEGGDEFIGRGRKTKTKTKPKPKPKPEPEPKPEPKTDHDIPVSISMATTVPIESSFEAGSGESSEGTVG